MSRPKNEAEWTQLIERVRAEIDDQGEFAIGATTFDVKEYHRGVRDGLGRLEEIVNDLFEDENG